MNVLRISHVQSRSAGQTSEAGVQTCGFAGNQELAWCKGRGRYFGGGVVRSSTGQLVFSPPVCRDLEAARPYTLLCRMRTLLQGNILLGVLPAVRREPLSN